MLKRLPFFRRRKNPPAPAMTALTLDQSAIEEILRAACEKDSFAELEDEQRALAQGVTWRRRRFGWSDGHSGEEFGLCINELRVAREAGAALAPTVAMATPGLTDFEAIEYAYWQTVWASGARRVEKGSRASRIFVNMRALTCARTGAPRGPWEDLLVLQERIHRGEWADQWLEMVPSLSPTARREPGSDEVEVARYLPAFPPSWHVTAHAKVLAATNGGYFLNFPEEYEDGLSALHQPLGALYSQGQLHMPPWIRRPCAVEWADGFRGIELLGPDNLALRVGDQQAYLLATGVHHPDAPATVWRTFDEAIPHPAYDEECVDLVFCGTGLAHVTPPGEHKPPIGGAVVRLVGEYAKPWRTWLSDPGTRPFPAWDLVLLPSRDVPLAWVIAAGPKLVQDAIEIEGEDLLRPLVAGEFRAGGPPPTRFPYDTDKTRGPRTAIGITRAQEWVVVVVDGRTEPSHSIGLTLSELARLMRQLGCVTAMNLDGGGSSVMAIEGVGSLDQLKPDIAVSVANIPCDPGARERIVPVMLSVTAR